MESFALGMTDAALFYLLLAPSAAHLNYLIGKIKSPEPNFYKIKAMQLLSARLQSLTDGIPDSIIFIVVYLATADVSFSLYINIDNLSNFALLNSV
jgi:hypothetical protein